MTAPVRRSLAICIACLLLAVVPARAQEVQTILAQQVWWVSGVCVGVDQCGFCSASAGAEADKEVSLHVSSEDEVSVMAAGKTGTDAATLAIGSHSFTLAGPVDDRFSAAKADAGGILQAMQQETGATLHFDGDAATATYRYDLAEFPKAYAAMLRACRRP